MKNWFFVLVLTGGIGAQVIRDLPEAMMAKLESGAAAVMRTKGIPGLTLAVGRKGVVRYAQGFGQADVENDVSAGPDTRFRTASIAKSMTAVAVMQLVERGKLDLEADIRKYCRDWPEKRWPITVRQLLGHQGGVRHYARPGEARGTRSFASLAGTLSLFKDSALVCEPGTAFCYTTYGYTLLGIAIEAGSNATFNGFMADSVWRRAGMKHTLPDIHHLIVKDRARGYRKLDRLGWLQLPEFARRQCKPGEICRAHLHDTTMKVPGGGILSTSPDLVRFGLALLGDQLVSEKTRQAMWTRGRLKDGSHTSYGLGFNVSTSGETPLIAHSGSQAGTSTYLAIYPEHGLVVAAMCNLTGIGVRDLVRGSARVLLSGN